MKAITYHGLKLEYWHWLIAVGVFLFLYLLADFVIEQIRKKKITAFLSGFCAKNGYELSVARGKAYDYAIATGTRTLFIKTTCVPPHAAITINSKDTWSLTYGGPRGKQRGYARQRYLTELVAFLRGDFPGVRVVLIYPTVDKVQRYLNESEIAILNHKQAAHGIRFITFVDWESHFPDLL
jgi:hypothetical protein